MKICRAWLGLSPGKWVFRLKSFFVFFVFFFAPPGLCDFVFVADSLPGSSRQNSKHALEWGSRCANVIYFTITSLGTLPTSGCIRIECTPPYSHGGDTGLLKLLSLAVNHVWRHLEVKPHKLEPRKASSTEPLIAILDTALGQELSKQSTSHSHKWHPDMWPQGYFFFKSLVSFFNCAGHTDHFF